VRNGWLVYVVVGMLAVGAGVMIAGLPDNVSVDATIVPPTTAETTPPTTTAVAPDPSGPATTTVAPVTTEPGDP
jgi:hypothetical protein